MFDGDECSVCAAQLLDCPEGQWAVHWDGPFGTAIIAETCGPACAEKVDALRDPEGRLDAAAVGRAFPHDGKD